LIENFEYLTGVEPVFRDEEEWLDQEPSDNAGGNIRLSTAQLGLRGSQVKEIGSVTADLGGW